MTHTRTTRSLKIGQVQVGGGAPVSVQSMTKTATRDAEATACQIAELGAAGCDIVRVAVPDKDAVKALPSILRASTLPIVADVHFDYRLAIAAIEAGVQGVRINPGNIGAAKHVAAVAHAARSHNIPIRVGVNAGSLEKRLRLTHGDRRAEAIVASALEQCTRLERYGATALKVSLKASDVRTTVTACRLFAARADFPLHLGVTEAGTEPAGSIKSAVAIGALLLDGIGDTIRVSLTGPPVREVLVGIQILQALGLRKAAPELISCPTCARTKIDLIGLVAQVEAEIAKIKAAGHQIQLGTIAIMGCAVNGPGEARDADVGIAAGDGHAVLFRRGKIVRSMPENKILAALLDEIRHHTVPTGHQ